MRIVIVVLMLIAFSFPAFSQPVTNRPAAPSVSVGPRSTDNYWDDVMVSGYTLRTSGSSDPDLQTWASHTPLIVYFFDPDADQQIFGSIQMPHRWDGSAINFHVHWFPRAVSDGDPANQVPEWCIDYSWAEDGVVFPALTTGTCGTTPIPNDATIALDKHYMTVVGTLTPGTGADQGSSVLYFRLYRNADGGNDTHESDVGLVSVDAHFRSNKLGSLTAVPD